MKKVLVVLALSLLTALFFCTTVSAYDHLITNDTAAIIGTGSMSASAGLLYTTASNAFDADGEKADDDWDDSVTGMAVPVKFRYGVMDGLEAFAVLPFEKWDDNNWDTGESGLGDLWVGAKYTLMPDGLVTLRGALDIPLGDDEKGLGEVGGFGIDVGALTMMQMDALGLFGQAGVRYNVEDGDTKIQPGLAIYLDGEASYALSDALGLQGGLEIGFVGDSKWDGNDVDDSGSSWIELNAGVCYSLADNMGIKGDVLYNIAGKNIDAYMGALIAFQYGF